MAAMKTNHNRRNRVNSRRIKKKVSNKNKILLAGYVLILPILCLYVYFAFYYQNHFYGKTIINGISASNMSVMEVQDIITAQVKSYRLTFVGRNDVTDTIMGEDISLHTVFEKGLSDLLKEQNNFSWPVSMFQTHDLEVKTMLKYDDALLEKRVKKLKFFEEANLIKPVNASISGYGENGYELIPENPGAFMEEEKLFESAKKAVNSLEETIILEDEGIYEEPVITSENPDLLKAYKKMKRIAGAEITYEFGKDTEVLDGSKISEWITLDENFKVHFDESGIKEYVDYIGKTYNSFGRERNFKTSYGKEIKVKGGDYGWWLNRPEEVAELTELIKKGKKLTKTPVYFQTAQQYGKDDVGNTYVEVNLSAQHLFFYKEGKLIVEADFVSGNMAKDYGTPTGTYPVQYKENDATLVGEDYETPVKYWMPFNKNIGFHDAVWRKAFGKDIFLTNGSHGCINMPPAAAKKMFQHISRGVAVVVYKLPGTENYEIKEEKDSKDTIATVATKKLTTAE